MLRLGSCLSLLVSFLLQAGSEAEEPHNISLVVLAPFPNASGWDPGPVLIPAARVAVREINNDTSILPGFRLNLIEADDGCSVTSKVTVSFLRDIYENKNHQVVGIIGPGCSGTALRVSNFTARHQVSLIHITPSATTPALENPARNTTYATISSAFSYVQSFLALMEHRRWGNIATMQDVARSYFKQTHTQFRKEVELRKVRDTKSLFSSDQGESVIPLDSLRDSQARVVMVFAGSDIAAQLLCYAYHKDMLFPNFQWIFHDRRASQLVTNVEEFKVDNTEVSCSETQMEKATNGVILNQFHVTQVNKTKHLKQFQRTYEDYDKEYNRELLDYAAELKASMPEAKFKEPKPSDYGNTYHDAVWAMALALHHANKSIVDLTSYTFNHNEATKEIAAQLKRVKFEGMSGTIAFQSATRSPQTVINIKRIVNGVEQTIGTFDRGRNPNLKFNVPEDELDDIFISDVYDIKNEKVHIAFGAITIMLTVVLILLTGFLQLANTFWYNYHSIKATSPNITHLVFSGCYLFAIASLILSVQNTFTFNPVIYSVLCNIFTWCFILGYSLIFGTICTKIWRVYRLFRHFRNARPGHFLTDNSLVMFVTILLAVDLIICLTWNLYDPWIISITETPSKGTPTLYVTADCDCNHVTIWVIIISLYKGSILIFLVALSIMNRKIKRKDFQHTRKINILIYGITMLAGAGLPLYFLLKNISVYIGYIVLSSILLTTILLSCLTLFLPPVLPVLRMKITGQPEECEDRASRRKWASFRSTQDEY